MHRLYLPSWQGQVCTSAQHYRHRLNAIRKRPVQEDTAVVATRTFAAPALPADYRQNPHRKTNLRRPRERSPHEPRTRISSLLARRTRTPDKVTTCTQIFSRQIIKLAKFSITVRRHPSQAIICQGSERTQRAKRPVQHRQTDGYYRAARIGYLMIVLSFSGAVLRGSLKYIS